MLRYRLRWYALSTARLLLRRWQAVALIVGLTASASTSALGNMETLAYPLLALLTPDHGAAGRALHLLALLAVCGLWASMQRAQIEGGAFMEFAGALPFSPRQLRRLNIAVLLLADGPLLFLAAGALASTLVHYAPLTHVLLLCNLVVLALVTQVAVLERRIDHLLYVALTCTLLAGSFATRAALAIELLAAAGGVLALWAGPWRRWPRRTMPHKTAVSWAAASQRRSSRSGAGFQGLQLSALILYRGRRNEVMGKTLLASVMVTAASGMVQIFGNDARSLGVILIAQGCVALSISGMFRYLHMTHCASLGFSGALPLAPHWWRRFDLAVVTALCLPFLLALAVLACWSGSATPWQGAVSVVSYALLLCALSVPHLYTDRHAVVVGTVVTGSWIAAMFACLM
ncbi:MAG: hypothetical protein ABW202_20640 [Duganella sp.]